MSPYSKPTKTNKSVQLVLLVLLFFLPPATAYILFFSDFRPTSGGNHGDLVTPARPIQNLTLRTLGGQEFKLSELRQKWALLYLGSERCDQRCADNLFKINQVRLTQGKNIGRVTSVYIVPENLPRIDIDEVEKTYPSILILRANPGVFMGLIEQLSGTEETALQGPGHVYIVDPLGNLMMSYQVEADPSGMSKDLKRLLKLSQVG